MTEPERDSDRLEALAAEFLERRRQGEVPGIHEYAERHPDLADEIREVFPTIVRLEDLKQQRESASSGAAAAAVPGLVRLGDFRIVRELGRGGMGVVYEAEQESLRRRVALKVLGANVAGSPKLLARFRREAEAAARLHHTNIVPVFGVGEENGIHFYAMQCIDGPPLSEIIERLRSSDPPLTLSKIVQHYDPAQATAAAPRSGAETLPDLSSDAETPPQAPARIEFLESSGAGPPRVMVSPTSAGHDVAPAANRSARSLDWRLAAGFIANIADALHYAHTHGVLHRDVKPSNILLDRDQTVWITDFGLAKHDESGDLTKTGETPGTLRYMAPEQLSGPADGRSDVHSLGLTLYELLALQPAYTDNQQGRLIQKKASQPPPPLRTVNRRIPRDLETIVEKACALEPAHRYQTAAEFADDLRRFLDERPIRARRISPLARTWRWMRRNPLVASLSLLAGALLIAVGVAVAVGNYQTNRALADAVSAKGTAETERIRAEANLARAVAALEEIMSDISARGVPQSLQVSLDDEEGAAESILEATPVTAADADLLQKLLRFFNDFAASNRKNLTAETARTQLRIGEIRHRLGQLDAATAAYQEALETYTTLQTADAHDLDVVLAIADTQNRMATVQADSGDVRAAMQAHHDARETIESSAELMQTDGGRFALAQTLTLFGSVGSRAGAAEFMAGLGRGPRGPRGPDGSGGPRVGDGSRRPEPGAVPGTAGGVLAQPAPPRDDVAGREGASGFPPRGPFGPDRPSEPGRSLFTPPPPEQSIGRAISLLEELVAAQPDRAEYQLALAQAYRVEMRGRPRGRDSTVERTSEESAARAIAILEDLVRVHPDAPQYRFELADTLCLVPWWRGGDLAAAAVRLERAATLCGDLVGAYPLVPQYQALAAVTDRRLAALDERREQPGAALPRYKRAAATYEQLTTRFPSLSLYAIAWAQTLSEWADALDRSGNRSAARDQAVAAVNVAEQCRELRGEDPIFRAFLERLTRRRDRLERDDVRE